MSESPVLPQQPPVETVVKKRIQTFQALRHRNFRLLWISLVISSIGTWLQIVSQSLLVLKITHNSPLALGIVSLAQAASFFLFAFIGGSIADRSDKRKFLLVTQTCSMLLAFVLGILTLTGIIQVWMIVILAFCSGTVLSFDQPARSSLIPQLVPREDLMNAISLQTIVFNGSAFIGPTLGGLMIPVFTSLGAQLGATNGLAGYGGNFLLNGVSFLGIIFVLYFLQVPNDTRSRDERRGPLLNSIKASLGVVGKDPVLPWTLSGYAALLFFGPSTSLILPIFASQVLHITAIELGLLFSASGLGVILGALLIASLGDFKQKGKLLLISFLIWAASLLLFSISRSLWLSIFALLILGIGQNGVGATTITLMQTRVPPQMRGRVMSLNTLCIMGLRPLGDFPASGAIALIGGPLTVAVSAIIVGSYALFVLFPRSIIHTV
ncbi:MFS transporter [Ktedonobacteria bacterium brp13]|nr:MFS transporter [Ktedonobacteria bacterium brp13]